MATPHEIAGYLLDADIYDRLKDIEKRLYSDVPLTPDERRDVANAMNAVLGRAVPVDADYNPVS